MRSLCGEISVWLPMYAFTGLHPIDTLGPLWRDLLLALFIKLVFLDCCSSFLCSTFNLIFRAQQSKTTTAKRFFRYLGVSSSAQASLRVHTALLRLTCIINLPMLFSLCVVYTQHLFYPTVVSFNVLVETVVSS